jgi:hypothetical protein
VPHPLCFSRVRALSFGVSPVGFATVFHGADANGVSLVMEADAVVAVIFQQFSGLRGFCFFVRVFLDKIVKCDTIRDVENCA